MSPRLLPSILAALALALLAAGAGEALLQQRQDEQVRAATREALAGAAGPDFGSKVAALRDFVRAHVRNVDFSAAGRPFLRDSAAETLGTGKGRCGEATRVFVNMARAAGIPAQRLYLEGRKAHVVAVVADGEGRELIVDATNRFYIAEVEPLDALKRHAEFDAYSTFGWRRLKILRALLAWLYFLSSAAALASAALLRRRLPQRRAQDSREGFAVPVTLEGEGA